jgi:hypothetical protein
MNDVLKILRRNYYFTYVLLVLSAAAGFVLALHLHLHPGQQGEQTLSTIGIMLLLASAPYAFHYYKKQVEKLKRESAENQMRKIVNVVNVRLAIVCVPLMCNIIVYYLTASVSMLFAAAMSALILIYIKPSANIFTKDLRADEDSETEKTEEK